MNVKALFEQTAMSGRAGPAPCRALHPASIPLGYAQEIPANHARIVFGDIAVVVCLSVIGIRALRDGSEMTIDVRRAVHTCAGDG